MVMLERNLKCLEQISCKLGLTTLRTDRRAAANRSLAQWRVKWLIEHSVFKKKIVLN
jgi:hypothetical protein